VLAVAEGKFIVGELLLVQASASPGRRYAACQAWYGRDGRQVPVAPMCCFFAN